MVVLEYKYIMYITELRKRNLFIWMFRKRYKRKLKERLELLKKQYADGLIVKSAFEIWENMILKTI